MVVINIIQALLNHRMNSLKWILAFPGAIFLLLMGLIACRAVIGYQGLKTAWNGAQKAQRAAWIGVVLSILLPIIVCQFLYMPLVAIPAWYTTTWTTSREIAEVPNLPAIVFAAPLNYDLSMAKLYCSVNGWYDCLITPDPDHDSLERGDWSHFIMSPPKPERGTKEWNDFYRRPVARMDFQIYAEFVCKRPPSVLC